jgi:hypothetical protein
MKLLSERLAHIYSERPELEGERGQVGLVRASGASKSVVNQWLNDKIKSMDILYALNIEASLGYSHIWLMTGLGEPHVKPGLRAVLPEPPKAERPRMTLATDDELDLLDLYRLSTDRGRTAIVTTARTTPKRPAVEVLRDKG